MSLSLGLVLIYVAGVVGFFLGAAWAHLHRPAPRPRARLRVVR